VRSLTNTLPSRAAALQHETRVIPIVFVHVSDPVGTGFVEGLSYPGGNITGFLNLEATLAEKWLELLKEIAPRMLRTAVMFNPQTAPFAEYYLGPLHSAASKLGVTLFPSPVRSDDEIEVALAKTARDEGSGLIEMIDGFMYTRNRSSN
jgi:putative tryptophan/tyrosine transport system substrate-binding protein